MKLSSINPRGFIKAKDYINNKLDNLEPIFEVFADENGLNCTDEDDFSDPTNEYYADFVQWIQDYLDVRVDLFLDKLSFYSKNGKIPIYRMLGIEDNKVKHFLDNLQSPEYNKLGVYWTWKESVAEAYWGEGNNYYLLYGLVDENNIDWKVTVLANVSINFEGELEINVTENKEIKLLQVVDVNNKQLVPFKQKKFFA